MVEHASIMGVRRIVYVSSASVNGKHNFSEPFYPADIPMPESDYSFSKLEAENILLKSNIPEIVIVRPPRILWSNYSGNIKVLADLIRAGVPLPFGGLNKNMRDNISPFNLVDAIISCVRVVDIKKEIFLVSDQCPMSTRDLIVMIGKKVNRKPLLICCPRLLIKFAINYMPRNYLGRLDAMGLYNELTKNLLIDISNIHRLTGWMPIYSTEQEFLGLRPEVG
jgi:nucleoside-diphosphate-sugar epimerase